MAIHGMQAVLARFGFQLGRFCRSENVAKEIQELQQKLLDMEKAMEIQAASIDIVTKEVRAFAVRSFQSRE